MSTTRKASPDTAGPRGEPRVTEMSTTAYSLATRTSHEGDELVIDVPPTNSLACHSWLTSEATWLTDVNYEHRPRLTAGPRGSRCRRQSADGACEQAAGAAATSGSGCRGGETNGGSLLTGRRGPPRLPGPGHDPGTVARHTGLYRHGGWASYYKRDRARNRVISTVP